MILASTKNKLVIVAALCSSFGFSQDNPNVSDPIDTSNFYYLFWDINNDSKSDIVSWGKQLDCDSLFVFLGNDNGYYCSLRTHSFSNGGIYLVDKVSVVQETKNQLIKIETTFNGSGGHRVSQYIAYNVKKDQWRLVRTEETGVICKDKNDCDSYFCSIRQKLTLDEDVNWNRMRSFKERKDDCHCSFQERF